MDDRLVEGQRMWVMSRDNRKGRSAADKAKVVKVGRLWATLVGSWGGRPLKVPVVSDTRGLRSTAGDYPCTVYTDAQYVAWKQRGELCQSIHALRTIGFLESLTVEQLLAVCAAAGVPCVVPTAEDVLGAK